MVPKVFPMHTRLLSGRQRRPGNSKRILEIADFVVWLAGETVTARSLQYLRQEIR